MNVKTLVGSPDNNDVASRWMEEAKNDKFHAIVSLLTGSFSLVPASVREASRFSR